MVNEFQLPRQLQEELERIDFYDGDINMRQLALPWSEPGEEDSFDSLDEQAVDFRAERVAREALDVRQEAVPELVGISQRTKDGQVGKLVGGGYS